MKLNEIKTPVSAINGVGPTLTKILAKVNVFTVGDLLQYYPKKYEDRTKKIPLCDFAKHSKVFTVAQVIRHEWFGYGNMRTLKIIINDGTATAELIAFNRGFLEKVLSVDSIIYVNGSFFVKYGALQSSSFEATKLNATDLTNATFPNQGIVPVYPLTEGLTQKVLTKAISTAITQYLHGVEDELPESIVQKRGFYSKQWAIKNIHKPENLLDAKMARDYLAYEELFFFQKTILDRVHKRKGAYQFEVENSTPNGFISKEEFLASLSPLQKQFVQNLPFELTDDQRYVVHVMNQEIDLGYKQRNDLLNRFDDEGEISIQNYKLPFTMARLLQGDVGSGKTLTALLICLRIISWKGQCAFMAPTEILAKQHAETTANLLDKLGIRTAFLTGNVKSSGRNQILKALKNGEIDIIVGTHALFSNQVVYNDLQLAVIDEQHRFGVLQRQAILAKGRSLEKNGLTFEPHLLMMSATPIPQTLALTVFGDLDVCTIKSMPQGRKPIQTYLVKEGNEMNAYLAVRKELEQNHQAYFVYPAIDSESDDEDSSAVKIKSAIKNFEHLSNKIFPDFKCALIHSKVPEEEQSVILKEFREGKIQVLAATTVIEVGVDVPNATCMVIEQADRFGMAQLHQLRGRVGRSDLQSFCFLIYSKNINEYGIERMKALRQSTDGFFIAEQDLKIRGPGEVNGTVQAGSLELGVADIIKDNQLMMTARQDVISLEN